MVSLFERVIVFACGVLLVEHPVKHKAIPTAKNPCMIPPVFSHSLLEIKSLSGEMRAVNMMLWYERRITPPGYRFV
jgi:hypothetical protein